MSRYAPQNLLSDTISYPDLEIVVLWVKRHHSRSSFLFILGCIRVHVVRVQLLMYILLIVRLSDQGDWHWLTEPLASLCPVPVVLPSLNLDLMNIPIVLEYGVRERGEGGGDIVLLTLAGRCHLNKCVNVHWYNIAFEKLYIERRREEKKREGNIELSSLSISLQ